MNGSTTESLSGAFAECALDLPFLCARTSETARFVQRLDTMPSAAKSMACRKKAFTGIAFADEDLMLVA